jgi:hypothetical protein
MYTIPLVVSTQLKQAEEWLKTKLSHYFSVSTLGSTKIRAT